MQEIKNIFQEEVYKAINSLSKSKDIDATSIDLSSIKILVPPNPKLGDLTVAMQTYSKIFSMKPQELAIEIAKIINESMQSSKLGIISSTGPYINIKINHVNVISSILKKIYNEKDDYGSFNSDGKKAFEGNKIMVEFSSPNTNKPLHLGHLRNDALGESVSRILEKVGAEVFRTNIINDRGIHICKSIYAYKIFHEQKGDTPEKLGIKGDHFVGQCYVEFEKLNKLQHAEMNKQIEKLKETLKKSKKEIKKQENKNLSDEQIDKEIDFEIEEEIEEEYKKPTDAEKQAEALLVKWEKGDEETMKLWKLMNNWTIEGIKETYKRTGISFNKYDFESETYLKGRDEVLKGLEKGIFFKAPDNSIRVNVSEISSNSKEEKQSSNFFDDFNDEQSNIYKNTKVLLRGDGTSLYMTQDIGTAISRHITWPFNQLIYVVANEQNHHFKCLFYILKKLGYEWANKLYHLSYGLVNLPEGRMKSREGTIVDADDLINNLHESALLEMNEKKRDKPLENADDIAEKIALSALHYYLLQVTPMKDMLFDPKKSLSFKGNTGPYLQYVTTRIVSILEKAKENGISINDCYVNLLGQQEEWDLAKILSEFPVVIYQAAKTLNPCLITQYCYDVGKVFNKFYEKIPILNEKKEEYKIARLFLLECTLIVMKNAMHLVLVPFLKNM